MNYQDDQSAILEYLNRKADEAIRPPPTLTVSEWAEQKRQLSPEASAEPGQWRNERAPHLVAVMDACSASDPASDVVLCASSQSGKTEALNNFVGYVIDQDPGPMLVIQPNQKPMGEAWSKDRLAPMLRDTPALHDKVAASKGRDSANTILHKTFPGGHLTIGGANSPAGLASRPIRYLALDEIDRYEVTKEGHAIPLATRRTQTFWNRKILKASSPTYDDVGILAELESCDQRFEWQLPCDSCGQFQMPRLKHFEWQKRDTDNAVYICEHCNHRHELKQGYALKKAGQWRQIQDGERRKVGFYINQFGSTLADWRETLREFLVVKDDPQKLQVYVNTVLAEGWTEPGEELDGNNLLMRAEQYPAEVPRAALLLTAGVDVQDDRIEAYVVGWGEGEESWFIDAVQLYGKTDQQQVWNDLADFLRTDYKHETGAQLQIASTFIDSGHRADFVYEFCRKQGGRIFAAKGVGGEQQPMLAAAVQKLTGRGRRKVPIMPLGVDSIKAVIYARLRIDEVGPGYVHIPTGHGLFAAEFIAQLTAEKRITKLKRGYPVKEWRQTRARNEALDCTVYAFGAMRHLNPNWRRLSAVLMPAEEAPQADKPAYQRQPRFVRNKRGFAQRWR